MDRTRIALLALSLCALAATAQAADRTRIVNEGGIKDQWMLADGVKLAAPGYPAAAKARGDNVCVAVAYAIKPDGTTSDFAVVKQWSSAPDAAATKGYYDEFVQAGAGALAQWKFKPRPEVTDPRRTVTVATLHFLGNQPMDVAALRSQCQVPDLASAIQDAKHHATDRDVTRRDMERAARTGATSQSMIQNPAAAQGQTR